MEDAIKVIYDPTVDALTIILSDVPVDTSDEVELGVVFDYDASGNVIGIEILDTSTRVEKPNAVELLYAQPV